MVLVVAKAPPVPLHNAIAAMPLHPKSGVHKVTTRDALHSDIPNPRLQPVSTQVNVRPFGKSDMEVLAATAQQLQQRRKQPGTLYTSLSPNLATSGITSNNISTHANVLPSPARSHISACSTQASTISIRHRPRKAQVQNPNATAEFPNLLPPPKHRDPPPATTTSSSHKFRTIRELKEQDEKRKSPDYPLPHAPAPASTLSAGKNSSNPHQPHQRRQSPVIKNKGTIPREILEALIVEQEQKHQQQQQQQQGQTSGARGSPTTPPSHQSKGCEKNNNAGAAGGTTTVSGTTHTRTHFTDASSVHERVDTLEHHLAELRNDRNNAEASLQTILSTREALLAMLDPADRDQIEQALREEKDKEKKKPILDWLEKV